MSFDFFDEVFSDFSGWHCIAACNTAARHDAGLLSARNPQ
jgi:hypothetical protein